MKIYFDRITEIFIEVEKLEKALLYTAKQNKGVSLLDSISVEDLQEVVAKTYGYDKYTDLVRNISEKKPQFGSLTRNELPDIRCSQSNWIEDLFFRKGFTPCKARWLAVTTWAVLTSNDRKKSKTF